MSNFTIGFIAGLLIMEILWGTLGIYYNLFPCKIVAVTCGVVAVIMGIIQRKKL
jgi:hypothetical protein